MLVLTQPQKIFRADFAGQIQSFRAQSNPLAGHTLALIVVIANAQVFLEVLLSVLQVVLRFCRDHRQDNTRTVRACCVADTPQQSRSVMNCGHENERSSDAEARQPALGHLLHRP